MERDLERKAHDQTRKEAEYRILELEARLARRDVELEKCVVLGERGRDKGPKHGDHAKSDRGTLGKHPHLTKEDALMVMEATSTKNKVLELEVKGLFKQVRTLFFALRCDVRS